MPRSVFGLGVREGRFQRFRLSSHTRPHPPKDFASARCRVVLAKTRLAIASGRARHTRTHPSPFTTITSKMAAFAATTPSLKARARRAFPDAIAARRARKKALSAVCRRGPSLGIAGVARARRRRDARDLPSTLLTFPSRLQVEFRGQTAGLKRGKAVKVRALRRASRGIISGRIPGSAETSRSVRDAARLDATASTGR